MVKKQLAVGLISLIGCSSYAYAGWPVFSVLTSAQIKALETSTGCFAGEVKIPTGTKVRIENQGIPKDEFWSWDYQGDDQCFYPNKHLSYLNLTQTGRYSPSTITTYYGFPGSIAPVEFIFHIPPPYWDCGYWTAKDGQVQIGCAQDEK